MGKREQNKFQKLIKPLASLKLAVFVILGIGTMSAWGTIVESLYKDAQRAQDLVYHSWYSYTIFALLTINLIAVIIDRYPWKKHHIGFISAHVGIITLIAGAVMTRYLGVDGSMAFDIGETRNTVMVNPTDVIVYSGLASGGVRPVFEKEVKFLKNTPTEKDPFVINIGNDQIVIDDFRPYSIPQNKVEASTKETDGPGLRFQIANERVSESDWILLSRAPFESKNMGPAQIILAKKGTYHYDGGNVLLLETSPPSEKLEYSVFTASKNGKTASGVVEAGDSIQTGWMGLTFRILKFLPAAKRTWTYEPLETKVEQSIPAIRFKFNGNEYWTGLNSSVRLFTDDQFLIFVYANRQLPLDFFIKLDKFNMGLYQGTRRAMSYESEVSVLNDQKGPASLRTTISMNEPLYHRGYTFYQSSFQQDEMGRPTMSILSVNWDPGRPWKYIGSLMIVFGIFHMFYFKKKKRTA